MSARDRAIAAALILAIVASVGFVIAYAFTASRLYEGIAFGVACAALAGGALGWAFLLVPPEEVVDQRDDYPSARSDRASESAEWQAGEAEITRRSLLVRLLSVALGVFGIALIVPLRSLGNAPDGTLLHTKWRRGSRLRRDDGALVRTQDLNVDSIVTVFPEDAVGDAQSQTVLIRLPNDIVDTTQGYVAYSRICTHAGCPVALYRAAAKQLMCPCHQSIFDVTGDGAVIAGPADHPLPRLPLTVDAEGYLRAGGDYPDPVGPGFWERG